MIGKRSDEAREVELDRLRYEVKQLRERVAQLEEALSATGDRRVVLNETYGEAMIRHER